jgi:TPR repeat protein
MAELQQKAEAGDAEAMGELAKAFWYGDGVQKSEPSALRWFEKAGAAGDVESMMRLGDIYLNGFSADGKDYNEARFWYEKAAAAGSDAAVRAAANTGIGRVLINLNRHDQAFPYLSKAATAGDMEAQCFLGHLYYNGRGTSRDQAAGRRWVEKAVAQGMSYCPKL